MAVDHAKKLSVSRIELYTRYTSTIWSMLHDKEIPVPPRSKWPANASLPPTREPDTQPTNKSSGSLDNAIPTAKKASPEKETDEVGGILAP